MEKAALIGDVVCDDVSYDSVSLISITASMPVKSVVHTVNLNKIISCYTLILLCQNPVHFNIHTSSEEKK